MATRMTASAALELDADDLREINDAAAKVSVQGDRYPEIQMRMVGK